MWELCIAYLIGCFPSGLIVSKLKGIDIKKLGSGNVGATNIYRNMGWFPGVMTLLLDCAKAIIAVGFVIGYDNLFKVPEIADTFSLGPLTFTKGGLAGLLAVLGHVVSLPLLLKGGKGVATGLGVLLALSPLVAPFSLFLFIGIFKAFRYVSLASIIAVSSVPLIVHIFSLYEPNYRFLVWLFVFLAIIITYKHKANISRLLAGNENRF